MKVRATIRKICPSCKLVRRGRKQFVICPANARHKQRQGFGTWAGQDAADGGLAMAMGGMGGGGGGAHVGAPHAAAGVAAAAMPALAVAALRAAYGMGPAAAVAVDAGSSTTTSCDAPPLSAAAAAAGLSRLRFSSWDDDDEGL